MFRNLFNRLFKDKMDLVYYKCDGLSTYFPTRIINLIYNKEEYKYFRPKTILQYY